MTPRSSRRLTVVLALGAVGLLTACGGDDAGSTPSSAPATSAGSPAPALSGSVKLGFFPNVTHSPALVGVAERFFAQRLGDRVTLKTFTFNAGPEASEALLSGAIDLTFIGPNPAINAFAKSNGEAIRIVSGSTSGGAFLVVRPEVSSVEQLRGKKIATPQLGNTQDVAVRSWLKANGLTATKEGGGDVSILPQANATTLEAFVNGAIDGAWVPEPWATRLIDEGGGHVLVDERDLWADTGGTYVTTHLVVRTDFLEQHPDLVKAVIEGLADSIDLIAADPTKAQADVVTQIGAVTGKAPSAEVTGKAFANLTFTLDPIAASLARSAQAATDVGLLDPVDLTGIYDLTLLDQVLVERGRPEVTGT